MSAAETARAATQLPDPMLTMGIDNQPVTGGSRFSANAEVLTMKRLGVVRAWVPAEKRAAREAAAQPSAGRERVMEPVAAAEATMLISSVGSAEDESGHARQRQAVAAASLRRCPARCSPSPNPTRWRRPCR